MKIFIPLLTLLFLTSIAFSQVQTVNDSQIADDFRVFYSEHKIKIHNPEPEPVNDYSISSLAGVLLASGETQGNYSEINTDSFEGTIIFTMNNDKYGLVRIKILLR